jgi:PAS domain S-box-containing protein
MAVPVAVLVEGSDGLSLEAASRGWLQALGLSRAGALGRPLKDVVLTEIWMLAASAVRQVRTSGKAVRFPVSLRGEDRQFIITARPTDVDRRAVILEGRRSERLTVPRDAVSENILQRLTGARALMNGGMYYLYELGGDDEPDLSRLLGYSNGHPAAGRDVFKGLVHSEDLHEVQAHRERVARLRDDQFSVVVCRMRHIDGDWRWIEARERVVGRDGEGAARRVLGFAVDASERHRLLESLAAASKALLMTESHERKRIARELHDSMAQHLVAIDLLLLRLEQRLQADGDQLDVIKEIRGALRAAHSEVRTFSYLLHPPDLERLGFETSLRKFLHGFGVRTGLDVRFRIEGESQAMESERELALFRVAQEAMMNVHTHAEARSVGVVLGYSADSVTLEVSDDGVGLSHDQIETLVSQQWGGVGVAGMTARMQQLGGRLDICAQPRGLLVRARLPLAEPGQAGLGVPEPT